MPTSAFSGSRLYLRSSRSTASACHHSAQRRSPDPQLFWNGVEGAKGFAKRSTWWDMLFMGIRGIGLMTMIY